MRDLAEATHVNFTKKHKYYYSQNVKSQAQSNDYINFVKQYISNENFLLVFKDPWTYINISNDNWMANGWKIHISANFNNHIEVLNIVAKYAIENKMNFKFCTNAQQFIYINSKNVARASSGKFIVLYPLEEQFIKTLDDLYDLLHEYDGPYILSDRPYKDSKIIYYRYGEINPIRFLDGYGTITTRMIDNKNKLIKDERVPYFKLPEFLQDNLYASINKEKSKLLQKYDIKESLHFSAQGGVYIGTYNNQNYVIKESRKYSGLDSNLKYGSERLKKEYTMLKTLEKLDCVPNLFEFIEDCGNVYLIEEYIEGEGLTKFSFINSPLVKVERNDNKIKEKFNKDLLNIMISSLKAIDKIHNEGIILNDISPNNIIYNNETGKVTFIDYEAAYHIVDECNKLNMYTPGFTSNGENNSLKHDLHKLGLVFINCIMPINKIFDLAPTKKAEALKLFESMDLISESILATIKGLINYGFSNSYEALMYLNSNPSISIENNNLENQSDVIENIKLIKESIIANIHYSDGQYVIASDPMGFFTSQYSFAFGIFGALYALNKLDIGEPISEDMVALIVNRFMTSFYRSPNSISPGLYVGLSGIAVSLADLGFINEARTVMESLINKNIDMADLTYGLSGRIVGLLKLYKITNDIKYIDLARNDANKIKKTAIVKDGLYYWKDEVGDIYTGLTRGSSGIALTLLYLYLETNNKEYLDFGVKSLEADLSKLIKNEQGHISFNSFPEGHELKVYSPYIHKGIAGLGVVLLRYFLITKNEKYKLIIDEVIEACDANMSLFPGYSRGMAGIMTFLQDCVIYLKSDYANEILTKMYRNIKFFQVSIDSINGYVGDELYRISNDLFTGSSGIILTLNRCIFLHDKIKNPFLILDEYYDFNYK